MSLPPINADSSLLAQQPLQQPTETTMDVSDVSAPGSGLGFNLAFDIGDMQHALMRSGQSSGSCGGLRRAISAPHSMNTLGWEPGMPLQQSQQSFGTSATSRQNYLAPSGGPMRRINSSLGLRRSSSFFWTPAAHHDFERAIHALGSRGAEVTAGNIMSEMSRALTAELKLADVDKHLRKKLLVQRRVLQQLSTSAERPANAIDPCASGLAGAAGSASAAAGAPSFAATACTEAGLGASGAPGGLPLRTMAPAGLLPPGIGSMAAVAEEPTSACGGALGEGTMRMGALGMGGGSGLGASGQQQHQASSAAAAAACQQAMASEMAGLAQQFNAQRMQHLQLAAAREALVAGEARMHEQ